ncbi:blue light sensor protein [Pseudoalteromonas sp. MSK9-3]|uniref:BLUF domain-containing protein n=1 Tax=Pseudoalteromonas sp. MSK9-3 TaxID=1897633 RepID=UPI000E6BAC29|nr:BLUF domain-containing protein [Pseudoalteromonas sp. MSK9-3]RJE72187.1 blue light sensor protein [Pseudoalteromonas sp. MSK9-3]
MSLHQLIYLSKASRALTSVDFLEILEVAKRNNASLGVTGSLFYNGGWFLQVLEGDVTVINSLYRRIEQDERHLQSQVIYLEPASCRVFSRWTMNMINLEKERDSKYDILVDVIKAATRGGLVEGLSPAVKLLKVFSSDHLFHSAC